MKIDGLIGASSDLQEKIQTENSDILEQVEIQVKYEGYIHKEQELAKKMMRLDKISIPDNFDYSKIQSLSSESREKLAAQRPKNLGQASRISGVSPADVSVLMVFMSR